MRKSFWDKRIPTLLGILAITLGTFLTSTLVGRQTNFIGQAAPTNIPREVRITNVGSSSFTVSYVTETDVVGTLSFGKDQNFGLLAFDERGKSLSSSVHSIKVNNLSPSTRYFFSILSGGETFLNNNLPYEATTGPTLPQEKPSGGFIVGKIMNTNGETLKQGLVYANVGSSQTYSAVLKQDGTYSISLEGIRSNDLSSYFDFKDTKIKMLAVAKEGKSNVSAKHKEVTSIPPIVITKNYDFTQDIPVSSTSATLQNFPDFPQTQGSSTIPRITTPAENQELSEQRPTFRGTAVPGSKITVVVESEREEAEITVDQNGNWIYRPTQTLTPGEHKITISARDAFGVLRTITHTFVILAGPEEAQASTPSASPSPSPSPSFTPAPTSTPTATPIVILPQSPTPIPTILPEVGNLNIALAGINLVKTLFGGLLFIVSRGNISF